MKDDIFTKLPLEFIKSCRYQPRRYFDKAKLNELADSIKTQGVLQPIIVRQDNQDYEIIAGERRWRAAQLVGLTEIPCIIKELSDAQTAIAATIENLQREDLNPIEEALGFKRLAEEFGYTHRELAQLLGLGRVKITHALRLLTLDERVQESLKQGALTEGHGKALAGLPKNQQYPLAVDCLNKAWTVRKLEQTIKNLQEHNIDHNKRATADERYLVLFSQLISEQLGTEVKFDQLEKGQGGWLKIRYYDNDILQGLLDKIGIIYE